MQVIIKNRDKENMTIKLQLTKAQVATLRAALNCHGKPVQFARAEMYAQGGGWYQIMSFETGEPSGLRLMDNGVDYWKHLNHSKKELLRKIRSVLADVAPVAPGTFVATKPIYGETYVCIRDGKVCDGRNHKKVHTKTLQKAFVPEKPKQIDAGLVARLANKFRSVHVK